jgi:hypothetical protein
MENNTDIIVLTSIIIVLFLVFIIATVREFNTISTSKFIETEEGGPRAEMMRFIGKLFTDDRIDASKKITFLNAVKPIIEDLLPDEKIKKE